MRKEYKFTVTHGDEEINKFMRACDLGVNGAYVTDTYNVTYKDDIVTDEQIEKTKAKLTEIHKLLGHEVKEIKIIEINER